MKLVVDASVAVAWVSEAEEHPYVRAVRQALGADPYVVPLLWHWEVANVLMGFERRGLCDDAGAIYRRLVRETQLETRTGDLFSRASEINLARRHRLSVYDAVYLALAISERTPLATLDRDLIAAARSEGCCFDPTAA